MKAVKNDKSGSKVGRSHPKTDKRHWLAKVVQRSYHRDDEEVQEKDFSVKIQFKGKRHRFVLGTANKTAAAQLLTTNAASDPVR